MLKKVKIFTAFCFSFVMLFTFSIISAATNENIAVFEEDGEYTIYTKDMGSKSFYYAFSDNENETNFEYQSPKVDNEGVNVAFVSKDAYAKYFADDNKSYMFIGNEPSKLSKIEVDLTESINSDDINLLKNITNIINVTTDKKTSVIDNEKEIITNTLGIVKLADNTLTDVKYTILNDNFDEFLTSLNDAKNLDSDKYTTIKTISEFKKSYNKLISDSSFVDLSGDEILQPENANNGDKYLLVLSAKNSDGNQIYDVKLLNSFVNSSTEKKEIVSSQEVEKVVNSPITNDSILLIAIASILVLALSVLVFIKLKKRNANHV